MVWMEADGTRCDEREVSDESSAGSGVWSVDSTRLAAVDGRAAMALARALASSSSPAVVVVVLRRRRPRTSQHSPTACTARALEQPSRLGG